MKEACVIILAVILSSTSYGQKNSIFDIKEIVDTTTAWKKTSKDFISPDSPFYEDNDYLVSRTCSGEWGGTIKFKNKKTGIEYSCSSTCPVAVNKISGKYIVTGTLGHMRGFSEIIEIDNPDLMEVFTLPKPRKKIGKTIIRYVGDNESRSVKGSCKLIDSIGVLTLASFPYEGHLFHIVTDFQKTFLARIENNKFVTIDTISNISIWTNNPQVIKTADNRFIFFFDNGSTNGYLDIFGNKIVLMRYK